MEWQLENCCLAQNTGRQKRIAVKHQLLHLKAKATSKSRKTAKVTPYLIKMEKYKGNGEIKKEREWHTFLKQPQQHIYQNLNRRG